MRDQIWFKPTLDPTDSCCVGDGSHPFIEVDESGPSESVPDRVPDWNPGHCSSGSSGPAQGPGNGQSACRVMFTAMMAEPIASIEAGERLRGGSR